MSNRALSYKDIYLVPKYGQLRSRDEADVSTTFLGRKFQLPIVPANMSTVINPELCKWLSQNDYFYIMHRFGDTLDFVRKANKEGWNLISISVGVKDVDKELLRKIAVENLRVDFITIDVANGHHILVKEMIEHIRGVDFRSHAGYIGLPKGSYTSILSEYKPKIIAGNVATGEAVQDLTSWKVDAIKCGIAGGKSCSTKVQTAFHVPMFTCVSACYQTGGGMPRYGGSLGTEARVPIIADGGIREPGDIAKALVGGASLVMIGSMLAACIDAPGENVYEATQGIKMSSCGGMAWGDTKGKIIGKKFHGSASEHQKGEKRHVEGFQIDLPCNGLTYAEKYAELTQCLQSSVSYGGGRDLTCFRSVRWVECS
jgi:GMP reductase